MEFLSESPNVDVSRAGERCWNIHSRVVDRVRARFPVSRHPQTAGLGEQEFTRRLEMRVATRQMAETGDRWVR
jgi:hypothetical protein